MANRNPLSKQRSVDGDDEKETEATVEQAVIAPGEEEEKKINVEEKEEELLGAASSAVAGGGEELQADEETNESAGELAEFERLSGEVRGIYENFPRVLDSNGDDMLVFITKTLFSDRMFQDREKLMICNNFLEEQILSRFGEAGNRQQVPKGGHDDTAQGGAVGGETEEQALIEVEWEHADSRIRMLMHKLCAFYGLLHNNKMQSTVIVIEYYPSRLINYPVSLTQLSRYWQLKRKLKRFTKEEADKYGSPPAAGGSSDHLIAKANLRRTQQQMVDNHPAGPVAYFGDYLFRSFDNNNQQRRRKELGGGSGNNCPTAAAEANSFVPPNSRRYHHSAQHQQARPFAKLHSMPTRDVSSAEHMASVRLQSERRTASIEVGGSGATPDPTALSPSQSSEAAGSAAAINGRSVTSSLSDNSSTTTTPPTSSSLGDLTPFTLNSDTAVYKLIRISLNSATKEDDDLYIVDPKRANPAVRLLNSDGSAYRHNSGATLTAYIQPSPSPSTADSLLSSSASVPNLHSRPSSESAAGDATVAAGSSGGGIKASVTSTPNSTNSHHRNHRNSDTTGSWNSNNNNNSSSSAASSYHTHRCRQKPAIVATPPVHHHHQQAQHHLQFAKNSPTAALYPPPPAVSMGNLFGFTSAPLHHYNQAPQHVSFVSTGGNGGGAGGAPAGFYPGVQQFNAGAILGATVPPHNMPTPPAGQQQAMTAAQFVQAAGGHRAAFQPPADAQVVYGIAPPQHGQQQAQQPTPPAMLSVMAPPPTHHQPTTAASPATAFFPSYFVLPPPHHHPPAAIVNNSQPPPAPPPPPPAALGHVVGAPAFVPHHPHPHHLLQHPAPPGALTHHIYHHQTRGQQQQGTGNRNGGGVPPNRGGRPNGRLYNAET